MEAKKVKTMTIHEMEDIVRIYGEDKNDYNILCYNPDTRKQMRIYFTGSDNVNKTVHFNVEDIDKEENSNKLTLIDAITEEILAGKNCFIYITPKKDLMSFEGTISYLKDNTWCECVVDKVFDDYCVAKKETLKRAAEIIFDKNEAI